jgi:hypothetical protein
MKKSVLFLAVASVIALASCNKSEPAAETTAVDSTAVVAVDSAAATVDSAAATVDTAAAAK